MVEISLLGSEGARAGNRPGYLTSRGRRSGPAALLALRLALRIGMLAAQQNRETFYERDCQGRAPPRLIAGARGHWQSAPKFGMSRSLGAPGTAEQSSFCAFRSPRVQVSGIR